MEKTIDIRIPARFQKEVEETIHRLKAEEQRKELARKNYAIGVEFWNKNVDYIQQKIDEGQDAFKWNQLVWQEIWMWASQAKVVDKEEWNWICDRRGFNKDQTDFLRKVLEAMGLRGDF